MEKGQFRLVSVGGGTGQGHILSGCKLLRNVQITAVVPTSDRGGSSEKLKSRLGVHNVGDLTQCMARLCMHQELGEATLKRFPDEVPGLGGDSGKNLIWALFENHYGFSGALELMHRLYSLNGHRVYPVSEEETELGVKCANGIWIWGEAQIDKLARNPLFEPSQHGFVEAVLRPEHPTVFPEVEEILPDADALLISPGDLFTSITPPLLALRSSIRSWHRIIMVCNLATKPGETDGYRMERYVDWVERLLGRPVDHIVYNSGTIPADIVRRYAAEGKTILSCIDLLRSRPKSQVCPADLWGTDAEGHLRHDPRKTAQALSEILEIKLCGIA